MVVTETSQKGIWTHGHLYGNGSRYVFSTYYRLGFRLLGLLKVFFYCAGVVCQEARFTSVKSLPFQCLCNVAFVGSAILFVLPVPVISDQEVCELKMNGREVIVNQQSTRD